MSILNLEVRKKMEASLKPEQKPTRIFNHYLVSKYTFSSWHVIGNDDKQVLLTLQQDYIRKGAEGVEIVDEYPYEIMVEWKKKDGK